MWPGKHAQERPEHVAYVMASTGEAVTYRELNDRSNRLAQCFYAAGLRFGDHIAVVMENRPEFFEVCWAAQRSGLYYTCINWHFNAEETAYILDDCDAQVLVISDTFADLATDLLDKMPGVKMRLMVGDDPSPGTTRTSRRATAFPPSRSRRSSRGSACSIRRARPAGRRACATRSRASPSAISRPRWG